MVRLALSASKVLHMEMRAAVRSHTGALVRSMGGSNESRASMRDATLDDDALDEAMPET